MNKRLLTFAVITLLLIFGLFPFSSSAHNGEKDELGGHFRTKDCMYFLHEPTSLAKSAENMYELIDLIKQYNSNGCKKDLTENKIELEDFSFRESQHTSKPVRSELELGQRYSATLERCVDGDTAVFSINGISYSIRFLFIDTPEYTKQKEPFGKEASEFTCSFLKKGSITIETDGNTLFDKYDRLLAWVFVEDKLHQEEITKAGLVEDFYDYGDYKYEELIRTAMTEAKENRMGIYADGSETKQADGLLFLFIGLGVLFFWFVFSKVRS